jgi:hypothetical protein
MQSLVSYLSSSQNHWQQKIICLITENRIIKQIEITKEDLILK